MNGALVQVNWGLAFMMQQSWQPSYSKRAAVFPGNGTWPWIRDGVKTALREAPFGKKGKEADPQLYALVLTHRGKRDPILAADVTC